MKINFLLTCLLLTVMEASAQYQWHNPQKNGTSQNSFIHNQGWNEDGGNFNRLPQRSQTKVRREVWELACESAGLTIRFKTDARDIKIKYTVTGPHGMPHMPATGVSGIDLYRLEDQAICFGSYSFGDTIRYDYRIDHGKHNGNEQEYVLYLPLYNGIKTMEIGVPDHHTFAFFPAGNEKPIVLYGTSIVQGACASRPGMAWGNIVSRSLGIPLINLGFSGNGKLEKEVLDFINEQEARVYILDCMANLNKHTAKQVQELVKQAVLQIREKHDTPILLVEHAGYSNANTNRKQHDACTEPNKGQKAAYEELKKSGIKNIHYLSRGELAYSPDSWVDEVHPSDFGMVQQAAAVEKKLRAITLPAAYTGRVYVDKNNNGQFDRGEKTLKGINVSDGLNVTGTAADGTYSLPGHPRERFIFITTPSGYKTLNRHYHPIGKKTDPYDFGLLPHDTGIARDGSHLYVHISDTEIFNSTDNGTWVKNIRNYAANERAAFIIHTGDICYENGMKEHIKLMNTENMNVSVFYCIGNHDLVKGKYGEEVFENTYGPVYYSFDVGHTHYIVTPMPHGDHTPGYTRLDVCRWLKNDLAHVRPGTPVVVFNHDILTHGNEFIYTGSNTESVNLNEHNLKAWVYGHWHINHMKKQGNVYTVCTGALDKGGIDHSTSAFRVMHVDAKGNFTSELRYPYLDKHICIASPHGLTASPVITVNVYSSASPVHEVRYSCLADGKTVLKNKHLSQITNWCWVVELPLATVYAGKELTLQVVAKFNNNETVETKSTFTYQPRQPHIKLTDNWHNLAGNAIHAAPTRAPLTDSLALAWVKNVGANIYMTSPLVHGGKIYTASIDEDLKGRAHVYALDGQSGEIMWKYSVRSSVKNTIAIDRDIVFAQDVLGNLYALDCKSGKLYWETQLPVNGLPALVEGVVAHDGVVYAGTGKSLCAFESATGKQIWKNNGWSQREGTTSTLTLGNGILVGSVQWGALYGNDSKTGKMLWSASDHGLRNRGASAAIHGSQLYIISEKSFFILEATTGKIIARKQLPYNLDVTSTPLLTDKEIIFGTANNGLVALDNQTLEEKWNCPVDDALVYTVPYSHPESRTIETTPVLVGKTVYVGASDGCIYGIDKETGKITWKHETGAPVFSSVAISGNTLIATDFGGNVYAFTLIDD